MSINTGLKVLAGAVAIAISGGAFASTTADANGTIILNLNDTSSGADYVFDTGLSVASFTGTTSVTPSFNLASDPNYVSFENAITAGDGIQYSVEGASVSTAATPVYTLDFSGAVPPVAQSGSNVNQAVQPIATLLATDSNPSGGSSYFAKGVNPAFGWVTGGYESTLVSNTGVSDNTAVGSSIAFYDATTTKPNSTKNGSGTLATFAGTWTLASNGVLSYTVPSAVPLPTSVLLLFSGVGMMGVITRRRRTGSAGTTSKEMTA